MNNIANQAVHSIDLNRVESFFETNHEKGLSNQEAERRLHTYGLNSLAKSSGPGAFSLFLRQFHNPLVYVLVASAALAAFMDKWTDALVVLGVVVVNAIIGFFQEFRAGKALEALSAMVPEKATVIRDALRIEIGAEKLVPGDLVFIQSGDKVPADLRLVDLRNLKIEEAALTGESVPVEKNTSLVRADAPLGDRGNMAYSGTLVTYGTGLGLVVGTGAETELGKISAMLKNTQSLETPLTKSLAKVGGLLTVSITCVALILIFVGWWRGYSIADALLASITLAVAAIPEGLPAIVTITLAIGVKRMADRRAVIRRLPAVETLGSTSMICSDKTGTLTKNEMTVQAIYTSSHSIRLTGTGYQPVGDIILNGVKVASPGEPILELLKAGALCNDAILQSNSGAYHIQGDPTEGALVVAFEKVGGNTVELRRSFPRVDVLPFESENQFMATLHAHNDGGNLLFMKGAPEVVVGECVFQNPAHKKNIEEAVKSFAREGMRVLAIAKKVSENSKIITSDYKGQMEFMGLQAMIDPARPEAIDAIKNCHCAGITVKMITGDHKETAHAIAKTLGIDNGEAPVSGEEIARTADKDLAVLAMKSNVFARVAPEHKLRLVQAIQSNGQIVAMTGDGVNDAPALKQANIGVAMGITGTSVSKEAAELVLTDDNFSTIQAAVEEGRRVYDNLVKSLAFVLPTNLGEALLILVAVMFFPVVNGQALMPILPVQILWINLVATVALALPLAFEAKEPDVMLRKPRDPSAPIFSKFIAYRTVLVAVLMAAGAIALFFFEYRSMLALGTTQALALREAQTMAVTTVIFFQIFYLFNCRSLKGSVFSIGIFSNKTIFWGIAALIGLHVCFVEMPLFNNLFSSAPLDLSSWIKAILVGAIVLPVVAIEKKLMKQS